MYFYISFPLTSYRCLIVTTYELRQILRVNIMIINFSSKKSLKTFWLKV